MFISKESGGCFPSTAKVNLENGKSALMSELQIGDKVQAGKRLLTHTSCKRGTAKKQQI